MQNNRRTKILIHGAWFIVGCFAGNYATSLIWMLNT
jgi:hypothetical protein